MRDVVLFALLVFGLSVGCLSFDEFLREKGAYLGDLQAEVVVLERECAALELEIAEVTSPSALAHRAESMGMVPAEEEDRQILEAEAEAEIAAADEEPNVFDLIGRLIWD